MGLFSKRSKVKDSARAIQSFIDEFVFPLKGLRFKSMVERDLCAFVCDELNGRYESAFGGDNESSIAIRYSEGRGLQGEVYVSNRRAVEAAEEIKRAVIAETEWNSPSRVRSCSITVSFTDYVPEESAFSFELQSADFSTPEQFRWSLSKICMAINAVATQLS